MNAIHIVCSRSNYSAAVLGVRCLQTSSGWSSPSTWYVGRHRTRYHSCRHFPCRLHMIDASWSFSSKPLHERERERERGLKKREDKGAGEKERGEEEDTERERERASIVCAVGHSFSIVFKKVIREQKNKGNETSKNPKKWISSSASTDREATETQREKQMLGVGNWTTFMNLRSVLLIFSTAWNCTDPLDENGNFTYTDDMNVGSTATLQSCKAQYNRSEDTSTRCGPDGNWTKPIPTCLSR